MGQVGDSAGGACEWHVISSGAGWGFNSKPFEARFSFTPRAMKVGLRSDMGLAVAMFPDTAWVGVNIWFQLGRCTRATGESTHCYIPYLLASKPSQHLKYSSKGPCFVF